MSRLETPTSEVGELEREKGRDLVIALLNDEISDFLSDIKEHNPNINEETLVEKYLTYLKIIWDNRFDPISDLYYKRVASKDADQRWDVVVNLTNARKRIIQARADGEHLKEPSWLWIDEEHDLTSSIRKINHKEMIAQLSLKERKILSSIVYGAVVWKMWLMTCELIPSVQPHIEKLHHDLESISQWVLNWDQTIGLMIITLFWYEAYVKIKEVWLSTYLKYNKFDTALNIVWWAELWTIGYDILYDDPTTGFASVLRAFRAFRLLQVLNKLSSVRELSDSINEAAPVVMKFTWIYFTASFVVMIMLSQLTKWHIGEFSTLWWSMNEMRNLFYADWFQPVLESIELSTTMDTVSKSAASILANGYQLLSSTFYFAIPTALFADIVNKSGTRVEQIVSLTLEKVGWIPDLLKDISHKLDLIIQNQKSKGL